MTDIIPAPFKRLILGAVLNDVSPIVALVIAVPDDLEMESAKNSRFNLHVGPTTPTEGQIPWSLALSLNLGTGV